MSFRFKYLLWIVIQGSSSMQVKLIKSGSKEAFGESGHAGMDSNYNHSPILLDIYPTMVQIHSGTMIFQLPLQLY